MGLLANGFRDKSGVFQTFGATASNNAYPSALMSNYARTGATRNISAGQGITDHKVGGVQLFRVVGMAKNLEAIGFQCVSGAKLYVARCFAVAA